MKGMFFTYALYSDTFNIIYVGKLTICKRINEHNGLGAFKTWACRYKPWRLLYVEEFSTRQDAMAREDQFKSGQGRKFLRSLI
ncbi:MAG: GIY-YIG nuclease family protein [Bacteroidetes bacterium]|nr:GIY-YIG nuclease family protein [Bacteroidota bacterium]